jgi:hypothetical protein
MADSFEFETLLVFSTHSIESFSKRKMDLANKVRYIELDIKRIMSQNVTNDIRITVLLDT